MYYLSTLIDNRKYHILPLNLQDSVAKEKMLFSFVLEKHKNSKKMLFSIAEDALLVCHGGYESDKSINWKDLSIELENDLLTLTVSANEDSGIKNEPFVPMDNEYIVYENQRFNIQIPANYSNSEIRVLLRAVFHDSIVFEGNFIIHLAPKNQIYDLVMDFGSEASQVAIHRRGELNNIFVRNNLVEDFLEYYPELFGKGIHQQTTDDKELYKSMFFLKKDNSVFNPTLEPGVHKENELLNLLTDRSNINWLTQNTFLIPNLKLAHLGGYNFELGFESKETNIFNAKSDNINDLILSIQEGVLSYFCQTLLKKIKRMSEAEQGNPKYLVIRLLIPNVFEQAKVSRMVRSLYENLYKLQEQADFYFLKGFEVNTISESDASFLGFKSTEEDKSIKGKKTELSDGKNYLIIDIGKGTTDFSILNINKDNHQLSSLYRSGFIGAGNVISYAFVDSIFASIFGKGSKERRQKIWESSLSETTDLSEKIKFMDVIETIKRNYSPTLQTQWKTLADLIPNEIAEVKNILENGDKVGVLNAIVTALQEVIKKQGSIKDEHNIINYYVQNFVDEIVQEVINSGQLLENPISKIIVTGRGFLFKGLRQEVENKFKIDTILTEEPKKICLQGAFSNDRINYDSNLVGYPEPHIFFTDPKSGEKMKKIVIGEQTIEFSLFNPLLDTVDSYLKKYPLFNKLKEQFQRMKEDINPVLGEIDEFVENHDEFADNSKSIQTPESVVQVILKRSDKELFFLRGKYIQNFNRHASTICISGINYKKHDIDSTEVNIFFNGEGFLIRSKNKCSTLGIEPYLFRDNHMVFKTLYPFVTENNPQNIYIKELIDDDDF
jgi:hypothetical protein